jgi:two-component system sensor histidine kinase KdpD
VFESEKAQRLVAVVAHEIAQPLTAIIFALQQISRTCTCDTHKSVEYAQRSAKRIKDLIDSLLKSTALSHGENSSDKYQYRLDDIVHEIVDIYNEDEQLQCDIKLKIKNANINVRVDKLRIGRVLSNLLNNACKYANSQNIDVTIWHDDVFAYVSVADDGPGVPIGLEEKIFIMGFRGQNRHGAPPGVGLGLHICREIIKDHNGVIFAKNKSDGGAVFTFMLPLMNR